MLIKFKTKEEKTVIIPEHNLLIIFENDEDGANRFGYRYQVSYKNIGISKLTGLDIDEIRDAYVGDGDLEFIND